jgi:hypothetical protein
LSAQQGYSTYKQELDLPGKSQIQYRVRRWMLDFLIAIHHKPIGREDKTGVDPWCCGTDGKSFCNRDGAR